MSHPVPKLAEQAGELLIRQLKKHEGVAEPTPPYSELIVRESTAPVKNR